MIFGLINKDSGPGFHRIMVPLLNMKDTDVFVTNGVKEEHFEEKKPTTVFYNRLIGDDIIKLQQKYQFKIVVDVDDWWHLDPSHILYQYHMENNMAAHQIKHLRMADVVTCTHERLAEKVYEYNRNVFVLPNAIPKNDPYFKFKKTQSEYTRIFWQGSVTHEKDIALLKGPIQRLDKRRFMMVMAGFMQQPEWERMVSMYTNGLRLKGYILPGLPPHQYYYNYSFADVCVCPLVNSPFNNQKSNLKILEAANAGLPVIASHVHPYLQMKGVMYVRSQKDWYNWLNHEDVWNIFAQQLQEAVDCNFNFEKINNKRKNILS